MIKLCLLLLTGCIFTIATAQQNMVDFGKAELKKAFATNKSENNFKIRFLIDKNLGEQSYYIHQDTQKQIIITGGDTIGLTDVCVF